MYTSKDNNVYILDRMTLEKKIVVQNKKTLKYIMDYNVNSIFYIIESSILILYKEGQIIGVDLSQEGDQELTFTLDLEKCIEEKDPEKDFNSPSSERFSCCNFKNYRNYIYFKYQDRLAMLDPERGQLSIEKKVKGYYIVDFCLYDSNEKIFGGYKKYRHLEGRILQNAKILVLLQSVDSAQIYTYDISSTEMKIKKSSAATIKLKKNFADSGFSCLGVGGRYISVCEMSSKREVSIMMLNRFTRESYSSPVIHLGRQVLHQRITQYGRWSMLTLILVHT